MHISAIAAETTRNPSNLPDPSNQSLPDITSCDDTSGESPSLVGPRSVPHGDCVTASLMQWAQGYAGVCVYVCLTYVRSFIATVSSSGVLSELEQQTSVYHSTLEQYATLHESQEGEVEVSCQL